MKIIIIAAGWATRLGKETIDIPKGLLKITKKSIIEMQLDLFQENHLSDITIITGPNKDKFKFKNVNYIQNKDSKNQEVLGSLMISKSIMNDEVLTSYSDIIFDASVFRSMLDFKGDIGIAVDLDWEKKYLNRTQHPKSEADNVLIENHRVLKIKKNIKESKSTQNLGEFVGLMKLSKNGSKQLVNCYEKIQNVHKGKFHDALSLEKAKLVDLLQELIENKIKIDAIPITGKWCEIDTEEDLELAKKKFVG